MSAYNAKNPNNILHFIDHYRIGGPGKTILNSCRFIDPHRYQIHVALFYSGLLRESDLASALIQKSIPHLIVPDFHGISFDILLRLRRYIRQQNISVVHTHGYKTNLLAVLLKIFIPDLKIASTYHGWITNDIKQRCYFHIDLALSFFFDAVIPVSNQMLNRFPPLVKSRSTTRRIHNALVIEDYLSDFNRRATRTQLGYADKHFVIGVIGRLSPEKGSLEALKSFQYLRTLSDSVKLLFIGEGPLKSELQHMVGAVELEDDVMLHGFVIDVQPYYSAIDLLLCPSFTEGISNVILEASAYRLPIVATAVGGTPEIITDHVNGLLVPAGHPRRWSNAVYKVLLDSNLGQKLGLAARHNIETRFDFGLRMRFIEHLYDTILHDQISNTSSC